MKIRGADCEVRLMPNMSLKKVEMPQQDAKIRAHNFGEVTHGYTPQMAIEEAKRCLNCRHKPCVKGCPVAVRIPEFISLIAEGDFEGAYLKIKETNTLPAVCGRVCPQENQCERQCVRNIKGESVAIGRLERFAADYFMQNYTEETPRIQKNGKKVAVIGAGPAGLSCAGDLAKRGYDVTIFEALHCAGGVLSYGIPEFRLPKDIVKKEIEALENMGVKIALNMVIGKILSVDELLKEHGFGAVFIGTGAGLPGFMGIDGENLNGVYSANEFLTRINLMKAYRFPKSDTPVNVGKRVLVVGGGNVAMDAARCALRFKAEEVTIAYRRSEKEMPARLEEVEHAKEEGVVFMTLTNPKRILGDEKGFVTGVECVRMALGEPDASGRRRPVQVAGSEHIVPADTVVIAVGQSPNPLLVQTTDGLGVSEKGTILVNENGETSRKLVYAGGDATTGAATVILAMGAGRAAAKAIDAELSSLL